MLPVVNSTLNTKWTGKLTGPELRPLTIHNKNYHERGKTSMEEKDCVLKIRTASRVAVLPVRHGIALNPPSNVSVGIATKVFIPQSHEYKILKSPVNIQNGNNAP